MTASVHLPAPEIRIDLTEFGPTFVDDPYPILALLREEQPVRRVSYHGVPAWFVTRFDDVQTVYGHPNISADRANAPAEALAVPWVAASEAIGLHRSMIHLDPPEHTRHRRMVSKAFTARRVEGLREFTRTTARQLLAEAAGRERTDVLADFSVPLASRVIMNLIGVPALDTAEFVGHATVFLSTDPADRVRQPEAMAWLRGYVNDLVAAKRAAPGEDLLSELIPTGPGGEALAETELASMTFLLLMAGLETTAAQVASGLLALLTHPDQLASLRAEPALLPGAIEEMLRWCGAAMASLPRYVTEDLMLGDVLIRKGDTVIASWAAANRDPRRFAEPDVFDLRRTDAAHVSFAYGMHYCLGAPLARMELHEAFAELVQHDIRLAVPPDELAWRVTPNLRGLSSLPVHVAGQRIPRTSP